MTMLHVTHLLPVYPSTSQYGPVHSQYGGGAVIVSFNAILVDPGQTPRSVASGLVLQCLSISFHGMPDINMKN